MSTTANEALDGDLYETGKGKRKSNAHLFRFDRQYGLDLVAGVDEAGRAALAGPLVAAAVLFDYRTIGQPEQELLAELNDSKKISAAVRERVRPQVLDLAAATATVIIPPDEIDRVGLHRSNLNALVRALAGLQLAGGAALPNEAALLVDGFALDGDRYRKVIRGDSQSAAIAAASIIAKTTRDRIDARVRSGVSGVWLRAPCRLPDQDSFGCRRRTRTVADSSPQLSGWLLPAAAVRRTKLNAARSTLNANPLPRPPPCLPDATSREEFSRATSWSCSTIPRTEDETSTLSADSA